MKKILSTLGCGVFVALVWAATPVAWAADGVKEVSVSAPALDEALAGKKTYNFVIVSADELIDEAGFHLAPKEIKAYLKKTKPDKKAAYVFWVPDDNAVALAKAMIQPFSKYGATVFVVRKTEPLAATTDAAKGASDKTKSLMLVGRANPKSHKAGDVFPPMMDRPDHLRPGKLPARVRYQFKSDADVVAAAEKTAQLLLASAPSSDLTGFKEVSLLNAGAWKHFSSIPELAATKPLISRVQLNGSVHQLEGRILKEPVQFAAVVQRLRALVEADGGGTVRALKPAEMDHWWTFIGFDIEEPVFILESKGGHYLWIVAWLRDSVFCIDELRALPRS